MKGVMNMAVPHPARPEVEHHDVAAFLCAAANYLCSPAGFETTGVSGWWLATGTSERAAEDTGRLLLDRAAAQTYPQLDPRSLSCEVTPSDERPTRTAAAVKCTVHIAVGSHERGSFARYSVGRQAWTLACSDAGWICAPLDSAVVLEGRKSFFKTWKPEIRQARQTVGGLYALNTERKPTKVLASGTGVELTVAIVAVSELYAYVAMPIDDAAPVAVCVGKIALTADLMAASNFQQPTKSVAPPWLVNAATAHILTIAKGVVFVDVRALRDCPRASVVAHRLRISASGEPRVELEDVYRSVDDAARQDEDLTSVRAAHECASVAFKAVHAAIASGTDPAATVVQRLRNTGVDGFTKSGLKGIRARRDRLFPLESAALGDVLPWREGPQVEFKAKINIADSTPATKGAQTNTERLRGIIAAMANSHGGAIFVGVTDDGEVIGAPPIVQDVRLTKFSPAMAQEAVQARELGVAPRRSSPASGTAPTAGPPSVVGAAWWKKAPPAAAVAPPTPAVAKRPGVGLPADRVAEAPPSPSLPPQVLTVIRVAPSAAPFHLPGPTADAAPVARAAASTVALSVLTMIDRLCAEGWHRDDGKRIRPQPLE